MRAINCSASRRRTRFLRPTRCVRTGLDDEPQYHVEIDRHKAEAFQAHDCGRSTTRSPPRGVRSTSTTSSIGGASRRCIIQGDAPFAHAAAGFRQMVRAQCLGADGAVLRLLPTGKWTYGSPKLERYNGVSSVEILGAPGAGIQHGANRSNEMEKLIGQASARNFVSTGPDFPTRRSGADRRRARSTPFRWRWFFSVSPRSMKAGRSRWRFCWSSRWA